MLNLFQTVWEPLRKDARLPLLITAAMGLFILYLLWQLAVIFFGNHDSRTESSLGAPVVALSSPDIAQFHLFGKYNQSVDVPHTPLPLNLEGIALSVNGAEPSRVLIASPGLPAKIYTVGDTVPGGLLIRQISRDHVILDHNGRLESLYLPVPNVSSTVTGVNP